MLVERCTRTDAWLGERPGDLVVFLSSAIVETMASLVRAAAARVVGAKAAAAPRPSGGVGRPLLAREARLGDVERLDLFRDPFLLAAPPEHPLAKRKRVRQRDLVGERLILLEDGH